MQTDAPRKGQSFHLPATLVTLLAVAADTGGSFSLFDARVVPQQGIPLHRHADDEAFLVLEGTFQFQVEDQQPSLGPGGFAFVPRHKLHRYINSHPQQEGHMLIITLPAGSHEGFFAEAGKPAASPFDPISMQPPDVEKLVTIGRRYGFEILPPTLEDMHGKGS